MVLMDVELVIWKISHQQRRRECLYLSQARSESPVQFRLKGAFEQLPQLGITQNLDQIEPEFARLTRKTPTNSVLFERKD